MFDGSPVHRKEQGALGSHFHGVGGHRRRRCPWRFWRSPGAQNQGSTKKTYKMVGKILDTHLLATLTRAVYANSPSQWVKSVITRYFFRTPYHESKWKKGEPSQPRIHPSMPYLGKAPPKVVPRVVLKEEGEGEGEEEEKNVFQP